MSKHRCGSLITLAVEKQTKKKDVASYTTCGCATTAQEEETAGLFFSIRHPVALTHQIDCYKSTLEIKWINK